MAILEKSRALYEKHGAPMLRRDFAAYEGRIAVGLVGRGSECFGYDDDVSTDHDCSAGFCLWLTDEDYAEIGAELEAAYSRLPILESRESLLAGKRRGVWRISEFYAEHIGLPAAPETEIQWLNIPDYALAEATNGEVWRDDLGLFSAIRASLLSMPEDLRKKKLAARAVAMAQSGQYNYSRCLRHSERGAAMLALGIFVTECCGMIHLLNSRHAPYYKWALRSLKSLPKLSSMGEALEFLLTGDNDAEGEKLKSAVIEDICAAVIKELKAQNLSDSESDYLEAHALSISSKIEDEALRRMHLMLG